MRASGRTTAPVREGLFTEEGLVGGRCSSCGDLQFPRTTLCPACQSDAVARLTLSTIGEVFTFTVVRAAPPGYLGETPYAYGIVELPEGIRVSTTIIADDLDAIRIGDRVAFTTIELAGGGEPVTSFAYRVTEQRT